ncbi:MAG: amidohydrolase family protein [gamma proteobacterium endosymbiont of Lamellibrachia anaximandri]|nr:amidohydrolase family protein [gamma proteobacterium endosymbiont of Lamellibrachia anaximandri]MBL3617518.1 amidohydrolase family protein [gamma proteobacterium endosymbiont of Lamellibrachia anaximandri]
MKTVDIHTHLLNPSVRFDRPLDRFIVRFFAKKLGVEVKRLKANPYSVYLESMARAISESQHLEKTCLFGVDSRVDHKGRDIHRDETVCASTEDVLAAAVHYPDSFIPFLSVNPDRPDALDLIDEYVERGCKGAKFLQNYWGIDLNNERFLPYYEKLKSNDIPLIIHIGCEYTIQSDPDYERLNMIELPLKSGVTVIAAHMGLGRPNYKFRFWRNLSRNPDFFDQDYYTLLEKLTVYDNLYADLSAILTPFKARSLRHISQQTMTHEKILFGTDFPVPFPIIFNTYDLDISTRLRINAMENPFDRYIEALLEYFPAGSAIYSNYQKVLGIT